MLRPVTTGLLLVSLAGCSLFGGDGGEVEVRTDDSSYTAIADETIELTVSNRSDDPIFYLCTGQIYLEELDGDTVAKSWMIHGFEECLSSEPVDVDQKETFDLSFDEKSALGNIDGAAFSETVDYRLTVDLFRDRAFKRKITGSESRSNRFKIVRNPVQ